MKRLLFSLLMLGLSVSLYAQVYGPGRSSTFPLFVQDTINAAVLENCPSGYHYLALNEWGRAWRDGVVEYVMTIDSTERATQQGHAIVDQWADGRVSLSSFSCPVF